MSRHVARRPGWRYLPLMPAATIRPPHAISGLVFVLASLPACAGRTPVAEETTPRSPSVAERVRADSVRRPYTEADIMYMTHMIGHHQQALLMAGWAPTHGASPEVQRLAERLINAQQDEIASMRQWLGDRGKPAGGEMHGMLMPGMLTPAQLADLDAARGEAFDRLFLASMIRHHQGAVGMVRDLFATPGAGRDFTVFKFANDVSVDQRTEIARMEKMLATLNAESFTQ
ncbi:MAG TPA: DUF305 domain-containing protein [Gemmatimonadales bacterium]|nr:DUF305 domain-containing protein [Gemmatimonadales bacterium]